MLKMARGGTFMGLLEEIRRLMMRKLVQRSKEYEMWETKVTLVINKKMQRAQEMVEILE